MIEVTATIFARDLHGFLGRVEHGETVVISNHGRPVARLTPESGFISGKKAAALFRSHQADPETADAISAQIRKLDQETDNALAH